MNAATVSVLIPAFNAADHLARALESALGQTVPPDEIVVVDDGSTDGTAELAASYGPLIRLVRHERNLGLSRTRNDGIRAATGEFIALLDADDRWLPTKLERQLDALAAVGGGVGVVFCLTRIVRLDGLTWIDCVDDPAPDRDPDAFLRTLLWKNAVSGSGCSPLIRRDLLIEVGGYDEALRTCEDWDLWLRLARRTRFHRVDEVLCEGYARIGGLSLELPSLLDDARSVLRRHLPSFLEDPGEAMGIEQRALELIAAYVASLGEVGEA